MSGKLASQARAALAYAGGLSSGIPDGGLQPVLPLSRQNWLFLRGRAIVFHDLALFAFPLTRQESGEIRLGAPVASPDRSSSSTCGGGGGGGKSTGGGPKRGKKKGCPRRGPGCKSADCNACADQAVAAIDYANRFADGMGEEVAWADIQRVRMGGGAVRRAPGKSPPVNGAPEGGYDVDTDRVGGGIHGSGWEIDHAKGVNVAPDAVSGRDPFQPFWGGPPFDPDGGGGGDPGRDPFEPFWDGPPYDPYADPGDPHGNGDPGDDPGDDPGPTGYDDPDQDLADAYQKYISEVDGDGDSNDDSGDDDSGDDDSGDDDSGDSGDDSGGEYGDYNGGDSGGGDTGIG